MEKLDASHSLGLKGLTGKPSSFLGPVCLPKVQRVLSAGF